jgi:hypothetical protein
VLAGSVRRTYAHAASRQRCTWVAANRSQRAGRLDRTRQLRAETGTPDAAEQARACSRAACETALSDETRGRLTQAAISALDCRRSVGGGAATNSPPTRVRIPRNSWPGWGRTPSVPRRSTFIPRPDVSVLWPMRSAEWRLPRSPKPDRLSHRARNGHAGRIRPVNPSGGSVSDWGE